MTANLLLSPPAPLRKAHDVLRHRAAMALQGRVAGDDAVGRADRIWGTPGDRWFTPQDPVWRVHHDAAMFVGGLRALLVQALHPLALAGVTDHSGYRGDPWGRLQRTSNFISTTTFGTVEDAERLIARVRGIHQRVRGTTTDGRAYHAADPHLLGWVHAAEAESFLATYQAYGPRPLTTEEADTYVAQIGSVAARVGVVDPPRTVADLRRVLVSYDGELEGSPLARSTARFVMLEPPMSVAARPAYALLVSGAVATLPDRYRELLGISLPPGGLRVLDAGGRLAASGVRWMLNDPPVRRARSLRA
ncbi:oxygenase MpaB family protein [Luteipulveratus sp. YIM 133132]|uniref:oxygenase MpaB family protein n=1 Tax=Luteipulveratus flavus TaxID=3031728 RepID=UPI0023B0AD98|nr:oxygenase MpaB family protein [Luteipulveratus sp. YIM 133132]MDE9367872.1 oxygenase MpaB family protein [Luteipulveratus sp. YIM 133132]